jgi:iron complex outermembrane recepter protein
MKHLTLTCLLVAGLFFHAYAQGLFITGQIKDASGQALEAATVSLLRASDSSLVKTELSDEQGRFEFSSVKADAFLIGVTLVGYERHISKQIPTSISSNNLELPTITLRAATNALKEVTVAAKKPFIERKTDRTIVNVESSILATGSSALDILERSPGVIVSQNDAISMRGRSGVIVMIDGKPNPMSGADLANFLRTMPSNSIDRIELITNPSAKYDAAGNAGIIDIKMKKDKNLGTNGSWSANYGQGVYPKAGTGINLNHRNKKMNLFGSYNYNFRKAMNDLRLYRTFFEDGSRTGAYDQRNYLVIPYHTNTLRAGADFFPNKKTTIGVVATANTNSFDPRAQNQSKIEGIVPRVTESYFSTSNESRDRWYSYAFNGNYKRVLDEKGQELSADLDYAEYGNQTDQLFTTRYTGLGGEALGPNFLLSGDLQGKLKIRSLKADYVLPLTQKIKFEAGLKSSVVDADNDLKFFDQSLAGSSILDTINSNHFIYKENINAGYLNYSQEWAKLSIQAGLRVENTNATGTQLANGEDFDRHYTNLFPSVFFNYKFSDKYETGLNLSRRLDRPSYQQLNPFRKFLDPSTFSAGNPYLNPQFTWSAEWSHTLWQKLSITLAASRTLDNITQVIAPVGGLDRITIQTDSNLTTVDYRSVAINYNFDITKWWSTINNFNTWIGQYSGNLANTTLRDGNLVAHLFTTHNFKINPTWAAELNFSYKTREIYGFMDLNPMWGLGAGIQKTVFNRRGVVKLAATDIFWQNLPSATIRFKDYHETFEVFRETRVVTLSFNYRFGSQQVQQARRRQGGAEEEKRRAG